jgi:hypothetical protein
LFWFLENKKKIKKINIIEIFFVPRKTRAKNKQAKKKTRKQNKKQKIKTNKNCKLQLN